MTDIVSQTTTGVRTIRNGSAAEITVVRPEKPRTAIQINHTGARGPRGEVGPPGPPGPPGESLISVIDGGFF